MDKIRDEQKEIIFIAAIFVIIISLGIFFAISLKTNKVEETLKTTDMLRVLYVIEDENASVLMTSHIESEMEQKMDYLGILEHGRLTKFGESLDVL